MTKRIASVSSTISIFYFLFVFLVCSSAFASESTVTFKSKPSGASVIVDGEIVCWETPCSKKLTKGKHRVIIQTDHYKPNYKDIQVKRNQRVYLKLKPYFGRLNVKSRPSNLEVRVDDLRVGRTPLKNFKVMPGKHSVTIGSECDKQVTKRVRIGRLKTKTIKAKIRASLATLKINAKSKSGSELKADIWVDDELVGRSPGNFKISACAENLQVKLSEYKPFTKKLDLAKGDTDELDIVLKTTKDKTDETIYNIGYGNSPAKGNIENALITIIEFSDYECPHCAKADKTIRSIMDEYGQYVRLYFRHYPLPFHKNAMGAAKASLAARNQGKFWEMHETMFDNNKDLSYNSLVSHAKTLALDEEKFQLDMYNIELEDEIYHDMQIAKKVKIKGTPCFFVNGKMFVGSMPYEKIEAIVKEAIEEAKAIGKTGDDLYNELMKNAKNPE